MVCGLCHLLRMQWDGLWSVSLTPDAVGWSVVVPLTLDLVGWSVVCVTYSGYSGMVFGLCHLLSVQWDGLWSVSFTLGLVGWSVVCVTYSGVIYEFIISYS